MGMGDEIMAAGDARVMQAADARPVAMRGKDGKARWHIMWENNPRIAKPEDVKRGLDVQWCNNCSGNRPYVAKHTKERWSYTDYKCRRGEIYLSDAERIISRRLVGRNAVVIEPNVKPNASPNKQWGADKWQALVDALPTVNWYQLMWGGPIRLKGARPVESLDFRRGAAMLSEAWVYVGPEGGLHHAAAAFNVPAVVIFGAMTSPKNTGYDDHTNIVRGGEPCGMRVRCEHCREAMDSITVAEVAAAVERKLLEHRN